MERLNELSRVNIDSARDKLLDILSNYQGYKSCPVLVVFDAYKRKEHPGAKSKYHNLDVVYTKTDETADAFIERTVHEIGHKYRVTVATNDGLEQLTVMSQGALRMSADNLREEIERLSRLEYGKLSGKSEAISLKNLRYNIIKKYKEQEIICKIH